MKKEEARTLINKKVGEDKSYKQIYLELDNLKQSKIIFKENIKEIKELQRQMDKLEKENKELSTKNFKLSFALTKIQDTKREEKKGKDLKKETRYIKRVISVLKMQEKPIGIKELCDGCCSNDKYIYPAIGFLEEYNIIKTIKVNKGVKYSI